MNSPTMGVTASRDALLQPYSVRSFGARIHPDQTRVTFYIAELRSEQIIANFESNRRVALTMSVPWSDNESYQLKGKFVSWRRNNEQDDEFLDEYMARLFDFAKQRLGLPVEILSRLNIGVYKPSVAVTFDVEMVFGQAPHPGTGERIS